ncbi:hypothetical protein ACP275_14G231200 [Erythranthe tilingii]
MDTYEVTKMVLTRIMSFEPASASRIMGYMMIQSQGDNEMLRLAYCPESLLLTRISEAKAFLGIDNCSNPPLSNSIRSNEPPFLQSSPRIMIPSNGFHLSNPSSPAAAAAAAGFPRSSPRPISYAAVVNGSNGSPSSSSRNNGSGSPGLQFYGGGPGGSSDFTDQFMGGGGGGGGGGRVPQQLQDHLLFLDDSSMVDPIMSPSGRSDSMLFPYREDANGLPSPHPHPHPFHRRSSSVNDAAFLSNLEEAAAGGGGGGGFGWRPCMYFAKGFCKNGSSCKFSHSEFGDGESIEMGSPNSSRFEEFYRMKALQQQRFAIMGHHSFPHNKNDFFPSGASSSARQIYLTFPADSTFREEDVSSYFSTFGPVQDVRIPYQPKRMFGFVTFVFPETVKHILAKGNPHFVCDSRVLVKPYKDKGKVPDKKHHQHFETGEYSGSLSPSGIDSREIFDLPVGPRMFSNSQEMMQRRKMEQEAAELHHAIQLQSRRMANLQLIDPNNQQLNHRFMLNLPAGVPISSPRQHPHLLLSQNVTPSSEATNQHVLQDDGQEASISIAVANDDQKLALEGTESSNNNTLNGNNNHQDSSDDDFYLSESLEHHLPDNLFSSPTKSAAERHSVFSSAEADNGGVTITNTSSNNSPVQYSNSPLGVDSLSYSRRTRNQ